MAGVEKILGFGEAVTNGTATHNLTLYKHPSGALVFGAGTVQWSWGLDSNHDRGANPPDQAMQQATINLFADMGAQPASLQPGADPSKPLVAVAASGDSLAPTASIVIAGFWLELHYQQSREHHRYRDRPRRRRRRRRRSVG